MIISFQTNSCSLDAQRQVGSTMDNLNRSIARLSSGYRISNAGDDAVGLAVSENLRTQIRSMAQAKRNAMDGMSMVQSAEGSLNEVSNILIRMRELSMQSASDAIGTNERGYLQIEFSALQSEIDRLANATEFNGQFLINGAFSIDSNALAFQVGIRNVSTCDRIAITIPSATTAAFNIESTTTSISQKTGAQAALGGLDNALQSLNTVRARLGTLENRLNVTISALTPMHDNLVTANSLIRDTDVAEETGNMTKQQVMLQAGTAILAQANTVPQLVLRLLQ